MKCSLLCISSLYVALFYLGKPITVNCQIAIIGGNFYTYHRNNSKWEDANKQCRGSGTGRLVNIADLKDADVVDFIKDSASKSASGDWIWTADKCGSFKCDQQVDWAPCYPVNITSGSFLKNVIVFDAQSGKYKNTYDDIANGDPDARVIQFVCRYHGANVLEGTGVVYANNNGLCFRQHSSHQYHCICNSGTCSGQRCKNMMAAEPAGQCCVATQCTSSRAPASTTVTPRPVTSTSSRDTSTPCSSSQAPAAATATQRVRVTSSVTTTPRVNQTNCSPNPCQNGGTCSANASSVTCSCVSAFQGPFCQSPVEDIDVAATQASAVTSSASGSNSTIGVIIGVSIAILLIAFVTYVVYNRKKKAQQQRATGNAAADASVASMSAGSFSSAMDMSMSSMGDLNRSNRAPRIAFRPSVTAYSSSTMSVTDF